MTEPRRRRQRRRQRRRDQAERDSHRNTLFTTVTVFSFASVMVGLAKATFKFPGSFSASIDFFLLSVGLMVLGSLMLWGLYAKGNRWSMAALVGISLLIIPITLHFGGFYTDTVEPAKVELTRNPDLPWGSNLPEVSNITAGTEPDLMMVIGNERVAFGEYRSIPARGDGDSIPGRLFVGEQPEQFGQPVREVLERRAREAELLGMPLPSTVRVNADQCTSFDRYFTFEQTLLKHGVERTELAVDTPFRIGFLRLKFGPTPADFDGAHVRITPGYVDLELPGEDAQRVVECPEESPRCFSVNACDQAQDFDALRKGFDGFQGEVYVLSVHPEVSLRHTVDLVDSLYWSDPNPGAWDVYLEPVVITLD